MSASEKAIKRLPKELGATARTADAGAKSNKRLEQAHGAAGKFLRYGLRRIVREEIRDATRWARAAGIAQIGGVSNALADV